MKKTEKNSSLTNPTSNCFSSILQRFACARNLPTHPSPPDPKPDKFTNHDDRDSINNAVAVKIQTQTQTQTRTQGRTGVSPGIVARLMGLESLPTSGNNDSLFRSKSLNALHFSPDFDPTRAREAFYHRRARTSASFHEQGHGSYNNFLAAVDEDMEVIGVINKAKKSETGRGQRKEEREMKEGVSNANGQQGSCRRGCLSKNKRYEEGYYSNSGRLRNKKNSREKCVMQKRKIVVNNNNNEIGRKRVDYSKKKEDFVNVEVQSDGLLSRSPVSVLDHHFELFDNSPSKEDSSSMQVITSSPRRKSKSSRKLKIYDEKPPQDLTTKPKKIDKESNKIDIKCKPKKAVEGEVAEYFVDLLGQICKLAEDNMSDPKWMEDHEGCKFEFMEELSMDVSEAVLEFLVNEFVDELVE